MHHGNPRLLIGAAAIALFSLLPSCPRPARGFVESTSTGGSGGAPPACGGTSAISNTSCPCVPGAVEACPYSGPPGTEGVGLCEAGARTCEPDGSAYGACSGEVTPIPEVCSTPEDDDCGGATPDCGALGWLLGAGDGAAQIGRSVAITTSGRVLFAGQTSGEMDFGQPLSAEGADGFVIVFDLDGHALSSRLFTGSDEQTAVSVVATPNGRAVVTGAFKKTIDFGGLLLVSGAGRDTYLATLSADGEVLSAQQISGPNDERPTALAADDKGGLALTLVATGPVDVGGPALPFDDGTDSFVIRYSAAGALAWATALGGHGQQETTSIALAPDGSVLVAGHTTGTLDCGPNCLYPGFGDPDLFVASLDGTTGAVLWVLTIPSPGDQSANAVSVGPDGTVIVTGTFGGTLDFGAAGTLTAPGFASNLFLVALGPGGTPTWARAAGDGTPQEGTAVLVAGDGDILLGGSHSGTPDLFGAQLPPTGPFPHPFLARLDPKGNARWAVGSTGIATGAPASLALGPPHAVIFGGTSTGDLTMAGVTLVSGGGKDAFVGRLAY